MLLKMCFLLIASPHARPQSIPCLSFNTKAVMAIDIKHNTKDLSNLEEPFVKDMFDKVLESGTSLINKLKITLKRHRKNNNTIMTFGICKVMTLKLEIKFFCGTRSVMIEKVVILNSNG